ncbi:hypothetical protein [Actinoallomurus iriomotensis]|uniref:Uncharacterized protein n=1 Tax=Actinoallomurus iriomotensis TaxID=478107 RepID=A0A9W6S490_9ACTN|nr:hypothetical protein [Actinoallomurus iriomotensis]GLY88316.1 hypothetical protein Airi02_062450 [Actinoallomurus iriomotensis]
MPTLVRRAEAEVFVDASTVDLTGESLCAEFEADWTSTGLVDADPAGDGAQVACGQEIGDVLVAVELWDAPAPPAAGDWQDVAEVSVAWRSAFLDFATTGDDPAARLELPGPGDYRLRVHGRGRDDGDPVEEYLIQVWPAPEAGPATLRSTSRIAALWRER